MQRTAKAIALVSGCQQNNNISNLRLCMSSKLPGLHPTLSILPNSRKKSLYRQDGCRTWILLLTALALELGFGGSLTVDEAKDFVWGDFVQWLNVCLYFLPVCMITGRRAGISTLRLLKFKVQDHLVRLRPCLSFFSR